MAALIPAAAIAMRVSYGKNGLDDLLRGPGRAGMFRSI
jgi:hypothetical protein